MFSFDRFRMPPSVFAPAYFWFLNDRLDDDRIVAQLKEMKKRGARSVCPHPIPPEFLAGFMSEMEPEYLSAGFFRKIRLIAETCKKLGMTCYLYDEGGWPSGGACGQVYAADPEKFARKVLMADGAGKYRIVVDKPDPEVRAPYPNLLTKGVAEKFIELTHERYFKHVGAFFGKTLRFAFTDEPAGPQHKVDKLPWTEDFFAEFRKRKGYDVEPLVPEMLAFSPLPEIVQALNDYSDVVSQLFVERYLRPLKNWCRKHRLLSGGHFNGEDEPENALFHFHGNNILRALREMDFPGIDVIWRQLWPGVRLHPFPKFASSAANQTRNRFVSAEIGGVFGSGTTPQQMKFLVDYLAVCGVNTFVIGTYPFSTSGNKIQGERPLFGPCNPLWKHWKPEHDRVARISFLAAAGKPAPGNALFYDTATLSRKNIVPKYEEQELAAYRMLQMQRDFDYLDDDLLSSAKISRGKLVAGKARYDRLVLSDFAEMTETARKNLETLKKHGLQVVSTDDIAKIAPTLKISPADWRFRVCKRLLPEGEVLYFVFNASNSTVSRRFAAEEKTAVAFCDAETGGVFRVPAENGAWKWRFAPWELAVFLVGGSAEKAAERPLARPEKILRTLRGKWEMRSVRQTSVTGRDYETCELPRSRVYSVVPGDWKQQLGGFFSGEAVYTKVFDGKSLSGATKIDLGVVRYAARVELNSINLGTRLYPPYSFALCGALKKGKNTLKITVVNTLANAIASPEVPARWRKFPRVNPYEKRERYFERESLPSGLFGPVTFK